MLHMVWWACEAHDNLNPNAACSASPTKISEVPLTSTVSCGIEPDPIHVVHILMALLCSFPNACDRCANFQVFSGISSDEMGDEKPLLAERDADLAQLISYFNSGDFTNALGCACRKTIALNIHTRGVCRHKVKLVIQLAIEGTKVDKTWTGEFPSDSFFPLLPSSRDMAGRQLLKSCNQSLCRGLMDSDLKWIGLKFSWDEVQFLALSWWLLVCCSLFESFLVKPLLARLRAVRQGKLRRR